jgi:hypothetical protein
MFSMGACMSTNGEETEMKKRSQKIDKDLEEDSKRLRRECKILLLGMLPLPRLGGATQVHANMYRRVR